MKGSIRYGVRRASCIQRLGFHVEQIHFIDTTTYSLYIEWRCSECGSCLSLES